MQAKRRYLHPFLDSDRWNLYEARSSDVIIATPFKSGTTWVQMIVLGLFYGIENPPIMKNVEHWIDFRFTSEDEMIERLNKQDNRRFIKTHLPFDAVPYHVNVNYIVVDRDPRDEFMSLWNHYSNMDVAMINRNLPSEIDPLPACPDNIHEFWKMWLTRGYFEWETEGYPFWSNLRHVQSWYDAREFDNVLHVHYGNLLSDTVSEIKKIAQFIGVAISDSQCAELAEYTSFKNTKKNLGRLFPGSYRFFEKGAETFFHKGTNGRWKSVLTKEDSELFGAVSREIVDDGCYRWLTTGVLHTQ